MAGGEHAQLVVCSLCLTGSVKLVKAVRIQEGETADDYACAEGHRFSIDWQLPPEVSGWPPPERARHMLALLKRRLTNELRAES